jgi:hypothetical protein
MGILTTVLGFFKSLLDYFRDKRLVDAGRNEAILEGEKKADEITNDINIAKSDDSVRKSTKSKYTKK